MREAAGVGPACARERRAQDVETCSRVRGEGEGIQLEAQLSERCVDTALGVALSYGTSEKRRAEAGREVSTTFALDFLVIGEGHSSSLKFVLIGDKPLILSTSSSSSSSPRALLFDECKLIPSMDGLK